MKLDKKAKAKDLYISPLFKKNLAYAYTFKPKNIFILSAKYGLVNLEKIIPPYEQTLNTMKSAEIKKWAEKVREQMDGKIDFKKDEIIFLAGERYRKYLMPYFLKTPKVPLQGLGIGKQLQFLKRKLTKIGDFYSRSTH
jgi:cytoplasmic iron level regulating protein YaaA (DUF328/UPF0246 family)